MKVRLAYGERGLEVDLPDEAEVVLPTHVPGLADESSALVDALRRPTFGPPLASLVRPGQRVVVVHSDLTRPAPNDRMLPPILAEIEGAGVRREDITLLNATGLHRPNTHEELVRMLGERLVREYRVVNHVASDLSRHVHLGQTAHGTEVWLDREYVEADVRILTGFVEPHFFAGFSGGAKSILPGVASELSVLRNHDAPHLGSPSATWGITYGNPVFEDGRAAARLAPPSFVVNVTLNDERRVTGVFSGELQPAHDAGCEFARKSAMRPVDRPYDVVVTTNSGYPLDLNLYQAVKGMSAGAQVVREGGAIVIAAECREGIGHPQFQEILRMADSPRDLLDVVYRPGFLKVDQWEAQMLANVLLRAPVYVHSAGLTPEDARLAQLTPVEDVGQTVRELAARLGPGARIGVLPQGPLTIPYLAQPALAGRA
jgi:lactate racemase